MPGDLSSSLLSLRDELRHARYRRELDTTALLTGDPAGFLPLLHFALLGISSELAQWVRERCGCDLSAKSDLRFVEIAWRLLRDHFGHRHKLTVQQLLSSSGFAELKVLLVLDVLRLCRAKANELRRTNPHHTCKATTPTSAAGSVSRRASRLTPRATPSPTSPPREDQPRSDVPQPTTVVELI